MSVTARDIMNPNVVAVPQDMDLRDLAKMFLKEGFSGAPVVDGDGELVGVISQTDLVYYNLTRADELVDDSQFYQHARIEGRHLPGGFQIADFNTGTVADIMTPVVHAVTERAGLQTIARTMTAKHIHRLIVRRGRRAVGIISALDVLRAFNRRDSRRGRGSTGSRARRSPARKRSATPR